MLRAVSQQDHDLKDVEAPCAKLGSHILPSAESPHGRGKGRRLPADGLGRAVLTMLTDPGGSNGRLRIAATDGGGSDGRRRNQGLRWVDKQTRGAEKACSWLLARALTQPLSPVMKALSASEHTRISV